MNIVIRTLAGITAALFATHLAAHHSAAMFDSRKTAVLSGTVIAFQWTNPHCWIQVSVPGEKGPAEWSVEMGPPSEMFRGGWRPGTLRPGDKVTVTVHPARDGSSGGLFISATDAEGKPLGKRPQTVETRQ
jgi:hypothetical protein